MKRAALRWLAVASAAGMFVVLVMGATVTNTGSAEGCGRSWPLCNGQLVPEFTVATAIEYSHRAVTGVEGVLVVVLALSMLTLRRAGEREVWLVGGLMLGTLLLQAGLGAAAVLAPQSPFILATHFGISLAAFASTYLAVVLVFERTGSAKRTNRTSATVPIVVTAYLLGVVYLGAYVRHAGISLACADWPLCNGQLVPTLDATTGVAFAHRVAALGGVALLAWLALRVRGREAWAAFGLALLQSASGAIVVWTQVALFSALAHAAIVALLFAALAHVLRDALSSAERNDFVVNVYPLSDVAARRLRDSAATSQPHVLATTNASVGDHPGQRAVADDSRG